MNFEQSPEFKRELKSLKKRWRTLEADLERAKPAIESLYIPVESVDINLYRKQFFDSKKAAIVVSAENGVEAVKIRLDTDAPGSQGKVRLVFVAVRIKNQIILIELFSKNDKEREDMLRINEYIK
jgi:hypothetical protein